VDTIFETGAGALVFTSDATVALVVFATPVDTPAETEFICTELLTELLTAPPRVTNDETGLVNVSFVSARGTLRTKTEVVRLEEIKEVTAKIHEAMCALHTLVTGHEIKPLWER